MQPFASVLGVDGDEDGDEVAGVGIPSRLDVLVRREALAIGQLEIDLLLEQHRRGLQHLAGEFGEAGAENEIGEQGVLLDEPLDPREHPLFGRGHAVFIVGHLVAGAGRAGGEGGDRFTHGGYAGRRKKAPEDEEPIAGKVVLLHRGEHGNHSRISLEMTSRVNDIDP